MSDKFLVADYIVVGLGGHGSAIAAHLADKGFSVVGLDQHPPAHSLGSSHGRSRVFRSAYFEHPSYVPLLKRALQLWRSLCVHDEESTTKGKRDATNLLTMTGSLIIGPRTSPIVIGAQASAREHSLPFSVLTHEEVRARWPRTFDGMRQDDSEIAVY